MGKHGFPSAEEINPKPEFLFWLNCRDRQNRPFNVYVEKAHPEQVHITMGIGFSSEHTTVIENAKLQEDVIGDKVIELSRLVVPFQDLKWPIATAFGISIMLPLDETFIIAKFFDEITRVRNAAIVSATIGMSYVRKATPTKPTTRRGTSRC